MVTTNLFNVAILPATSVFLYTKFLGIYTYSKSECMRRRRRYKIHKCNRITGGKHQYFANENVSVAARDGRGFSFDFLKQRVTAHLRTQRRAACAAVTTSPRNSIIVID